MKETSVEFNADFIKRMINRIEWPVLYNAADAVSGHFGFKFSIKFIFLKNF